MSVPQDLADEDGELFFDPVGEEDGAAEDVSAEDAPSAKDLAAEASSAKAEGNVLYGEGKYQQAVECYTIALAVAGSNSDLSELRAMCHSNKAICFIQLEQFEKAVSESTRAIQLNPSYLKALVRRAQAYEKLERYDEALADLKKIIELDPSNRQAVDTARRLTPIAEAKREKMKEEMLGKLKEVGNSLLGRFGMSLDNFNAVKDPATGSYSINMRK